MIFPILTMCGLKLQRHWALRAGMLAVFASTALSPALLFGQTAEQQVERPVREAEDQPRSILFPSGVPGPYFPDDDEIARAAEERLAQTPEPPENGDENIFTGDIAVAKIEEMIELDRSAYGTLMPGAGGLSKSIWQPSSFEKIESLLKVLKLPTKSLAMDAISQKLLLSFASAPTGKALVDLDDPQREEDEFERTDEQFDEALLKRFINLRLEKLIERGNLTDLVGFLQNLPEDTLAPEQKNAEILMLGGDLIGACQMTQLARTRSEERSRLASRFSVNRQDEGAEASAEDVFWLKMLGFCRLLEENNAGAQIVLDMLNEQGTSDYVFFDLLNKLMEAPEARGAFMSSAITSLDPLNYTILTLLDQPINADLIETSSPLIVSALVINPNLTAENRFQAAVKSYNAGGISAEILGNIYDLQQFTEMEYSNAVRLAQFDNRPLADALLYQAASRQQQDQDKASILGAIWQRASKNNDLGLKAALNRNTLRSINPTSRLMNSAHHIARGLLLAGDVERASQWYDFARQSAAGGDAEATRALLNIWPLITIAADRGSIRWSEDILNLWWNGQMVLAPESRDSRATLFYAIAEAFGHQVPEEKWTDLISDSHAQNVGSIPLGVWREMIRAVGENKPAQSIILSLIAMGPDGPGSLDAAGISTVIRLLRSLGLEQEARKVAIEALVANDF